MLGLRKPPPNLACQVQINCQARHRPSRPSPAPAVRKQGHVRCSGGGVFGSLNHSSASIKNMFRNWVSQFNWNICMHCCMYWSAAFYMYLCIYLPLTHLCNGCCLHIWIVSTLLTLIHKAFQPNNECNWARSLPCNALEIILMMMMMKTMVTTLMFRKLMQLRLQEYHTLHAYVWERMMKCVRSGTMNAWWNGDDHPRTQCVH